MRDITIDMLKKKVTSHEKRIAEARRIINDLEVEIRTRNSEISSFLHCIRVLEDGAE